MFELFNKENINYFILRDYYNVSSIYNTQDIDIYVSSKDKNNIKKIFMNEGLYTPLLNDNKYPHKQFYKIINNKIVKFDIVFGLYFGKANYFLKNNYELNNRRIVNGVFVPNEQLSLIGLILHIIFDKKVISDKNLKNLKYMLKEYKNNSYNIGNDILDVCSNLLKEEVNTPLLKIQEYKIIMKKYISKNIIKNVYLHLKRKINALLKIIVNRMSKRSIAFVGVDGSGKSSTINNINDLLYQRSKIVYMGEKDYKICLLNKLMKKKNCNIIEKIIRRLLLKIEPIYRYLNSRFSDKVILFDRYVDDIFINQPKIINKLLYKYFFPKPKLKFYLYCDLDTSFNRKKDIIDKKIFSEMKKRYDDYYLKKEQNIICINTTLIDEKKVIEIISKEIMKKYPNYMV